jgi:hypothetical protein
MGALPFSSGGGMHSAPWTKHHDGATYAILRNDDGSFGVEVIPGANPIVISGLEGEPGRRNGSPATRRPWLGQAAPGLHPLRR